MALYDGTNMVIYLPEICWETTCFLMVARINNWCVAISYLFKNVCARIIFVQQQMLFFSYFTIWATRLNLILYSSTKRIGPHWPFFIEVPLDAPFAAQELKWCGWVRKRREPTHRGNGVSISINKLIQRNRPLEHSEPTGLTTAEYYIFVR